LFVTREPYSHDELAQAGAELSPRRFDLVDAAELLELVASIRRPRRGVDDDEHCAGSSAGGRRRGVDADRLGAQAEDPAGSSPWWTPPSW